MHDTYKDNILPFDEPLPDLGFITQLTADLQEPNSRIKLVGDHINGSSIQIDGANWPLLPGYYIYPHRARYHDDNTSMSWVNSNTAMRVFIDRGFIVPDSDYANADMPITNKPEFAHKKLVPSIVHTYSNPKMDLRSLSALKSELDKVLRRLTPGETVIIGLPPEGRVVDIREANQVVDGLLMQPEFEDLRKIADEHRARIMEKARANAPSPDEKDKYK